MNDAKHGHAVTSADDVCPSPFAQKGMCPLNYHGTDLMSMPTAAATRLGTERLLEARGTKDRITTTDAARAMREGRAARLDRVACREAAR